MDMNLLAALDALLEHNSVAMAAERLNLTPPAVSRTLSRIRHVTGDDILVRAGRTMVPTPYAQSIRAQVRALVQEASTLLKPAGALDFATLDRVFTVRGHDALLAALAPTLIAKVGEEAPALRIRFLGEDASGRQEGLRTEVDLELSASVPTQPEITHQVLGDDPLVLALRRQHPLARARLSPEKLAALPHVIVSRRGRLRDRVDDAFAERGLSRRVVASLPTSAAALEVVARSDAATVVAKNLCAALCKALDIVQRPLPMPVMPAPIVLSWHRRFDSDGAHRWLRDSVADALKAALDR